MTQEDDIDSKNVILIMKEAGLSASSIEQGLTALRRANFVQKWIYYQAFFLLTIGIERLLKLTIITIHRVEENKLPDNGLLKSYGHDIEKLFESVSKHLSPKSKFLDSDVLYKQILSFLSQYASKSRYYNLDSLSGIGKTTDPLHQWQSIQTEIIKRHGKPVLLTGPEMLLINAMQESVSVLHTDESGAFQIVA